MPHLTVRNFSCIDSADLDLAEITLLIGPQASGKSVLSKLVHFFYECIEQIVDLETEAQSFDDYMKSTVDRFRQTFPPEAWGPAGFKVQFEAGSLSICLLRAKPRKKPGGNLRVVISKLLEQEFENVRQQFRAAIEKSEKSKPKSSEILVTARWDLRWKLRTASRKRVRELMGEYFIASQLFVPAGRSFFTSMGKAVTAFEHGGFLDPLTIRFGRYFLVMREHLSGLGIMYNDPEEEKARKVLEPFRKKMAEELFLGTIKFERNNDYVETTDGRKIPFSVLSSGQQELLPLWVAINQFFDRPSSEAIIYIEEPEAHLFPEAQGLITTYLVTILNQTPKNKMMITTHSPYILAKLNNMLKAGQISGNLSDIERDKVAKIIPRSAWLKPGRIKAYAIKDRILIPIIDEEGLIDGEYLDSVSGDIGREFNSLLEIEINHES